MWCLLSKLIFSKTTYWIVARRVKTLSRSRDVLIDAFFAKCPVSWLEIR